MLSMGKTWFNIVKNLIILLQLDLKHITRVNFYPSDNNFTQALLVMLVTNRRSKLCGFCVFHTETCEKWCVYYAFFSMFQKMDDKQ